MDADADADAVLAAYAEAWARGAPEDAFAFFAEDVVMRLPGRGALAGEHVGKDAVVAVIEQLLRRTDGASVDIDPVDRLVSADRVALVVRESVVRGDRRLTVRRTNLYRVAGGRIREIEIYEADQYEVDEFFG
jgi:ketosteroid isomerase-like protein